MNLKKTRAQIVVLATTITVLLGAVVYVTVDLYRAGQREILGQFNEIQTLLAKELARHLEEHLAEATLILKDLAATANAAGREPADVRQHLGEQIKQQHGFSRLSLAWLDDQGRTQFSAPEAKFSPTNLADKAWLAWVKQVENRDRILVRIQPNSSRSDSPGMGTCTLVAPLFPNQNGANANGPADAANWAGALVMTFDLDRMIKDQLRLLGEAAEAHKLWMMDQNGTVMLQTEHPAMVGENIHRTNDTCYQCHVSFEHVNRILHGGAGSIEYQLNDRKTKLAAFASARLNGQAWVLVINAPREALTGYFGRSTQAMLVLFGLLLAALMVVSVLFYRVHHSTVRAEEAAKRLQVDERLRDSEALYHSLVETLPQSIFRKDRDGRFTFANHRFCQSLGCTLEQIVGKNDLDFYPAELARHYRKADLEVMTSGKPWAMVEEYQPAQGERQYVQVVKTVLHDAEGNVIGVQGIFWDVTERKRNEEKLETLHRRLVDTSRQAGMAEVATGVLHNVGNVLNSVNVSCTVAMDRIRQSKVANLPKITALLEAQNGGLAEFLTHDPKGRQIPGYLCSLAPVLVEEQTGVLKELHSLREKIDHIKDIVAMQQSYAKFSGVMETIPVEQLAEDAIRLNSGAFARHGVYVERQYDAVPAVSTDKHKVLQILQNLLRNAKYACDEGKQEPKRIILRIFSPAPERVAIQVADNGIGIPPENLTRIFAHGFTTRAEGHGFGLHSGALAARELGGSLVAASAGVGQGATFTLELPIKPVATP